jgi:hypothetical protein
MPVLILELHVWYSNVFALMLCFLLMCLLLLLCECIIIIIILYLYKHTRSQYAFSSTQQVHSQHRSKIRQDKHRQANTTKHYSTHSSVGTRMPAQKLAPLHLANIPTDAQYMKKFPLHRPTLSSRKAPLTNDAHVTPPGPAASSPSECKSFIAFWPRRSYASTEKGTKP